MTNIDKPKEPTHRPKPEQPTKAPDKSPSRERNHPDSDKKIHVEPEGGPWPRRSR